jgi:hypothetical protein
MLTSVSDPDLLPDKGVGVSSGEATCLLLLLSPSSSTEPCIDDDSSPRGAGGSDKDCSLVATLCVELLSAGRRDGEREFSRERVVSIVLSGQW